MTTTNKNVAYYAHVIEYESGWGSRPDGHLVALDKESFNTKAKEINSQRGEEYSRVGSDPKLCLITDEMKEKLEKFGVIWTGNNKKDWIVEG